MTNTILHSIIQLRERREPGVLCTIVKTEGSTPLKAGAQMLVRTDRSIVGTIGGGALEHAAIDDAVQTIACGSSQLFQHHLTRDHNMCCGGTVHLYTQFLDIPAQCVIFGAGHVGSALAAILVPLDFNVLLVDGRPGIIDHVTKASNSRGQAESLHQGITFINEAPEVALSSLLWDTNTYAVIATHSHSLDREVLRLVLRQPYKYCGMIGSKRKVIVSRKLFLDRGWATEEELDRVDMPIGIDIAACSPAEIAVSIAAGMVAIKNQSKPTHTKDKIPITNELLDYEQTSEGLCVLHS
ncbi:MAG: XdhC family protein [Bacteroidota bacterium]|nr:XdhC family protein [Bacteroidota bacterium]MDP4233228.1 XdhC family protein [Bacteroidota bacterium]MDP4242153.1 XdhC family protein [Bacteroidota bacterium]MDP4287802.1 XdhC family protein [Bacteroidota bacterium]